jgi:hypothetical protein
VANSGPDLNARVQISYRDSNGEPSITGADITLPTTSQKEFFLYLSPQRSFQNLSVNLLVGKESLAKVDLNLTCLTNENLIIGVLAEDPSPYVILNEIETLNGSMRLAQLQPGDLPDQPQGWDGLDVMVVASQDVGTFSAAQHQALRSWLTNGGRLLVIGGLKWQTTTSGLEDVLPVAVDSTRNVGSLSALQAYSEAPISSVAPGVLAVGQLQPGAEVLLEQEGYPLIAQKQVGLGIVYYLAADPGLQPLAGWNGMQDLYSRLFAFRVPKPVWSNGRWDIYATNQALSMLTELGIPSIYYICGWLAVYIAIIGPVNYLVLRRLKRGELAWLTIPVVVIIFTWIAYFFGVFYRGAKPILNRIVLAQAWEGSDQARIRGLVGLYSPNRSKYTMEANDQFMFYPLEDSSLQKSGEWQTIQQGTNTVLPDVQVEIGGMKAISVEGNVPAMTFAHDLVLTVNSKSSLLRGRITNTSSFTLKNAVLVTPGAWQRLGDLPPSSQKSVNVSLATGRSGPQIYDYSALDPWNLTGLNNYDRGINRETLRQSALLRAIMYSNYEVSKTMWGIYLMGWLDEPLLPVRLRDRQFEAIDTTFYIMMLTPSFDIESGTVELSPNMFMWEASVESISPYFAESAYFPPEGFTIHFRPAVPIRFSEVKLLTLHIETSAQPKDVLVSLWDLEKAAWVQMKNLSWGDTNIPEPWRYVGLDGEIRLKIEGDQNTWVEIKQSNFTLVLEP